MDTIHIQSGAQLPSGFSADEYLSKRELAERLKKTPRTIESYMAKGILPYFKLNRSILFRWSDVQKHLDEHFRIIRQGK